VGRYAEPLNALALRFKYDFTLDRLLGTWLATAIAGRSDFDNIELWVPIPAHWRTRLKRGYQRTALLAEFVARHTGRGRVVAALTMTRRVTPFHMRPGLSAAARAAEIRGAFAVRNSSIVKNKSVCLIDDVSTTGATLLEARRVLREAGVRSISAAVVTKTSTIKSGVDPAAAES
jgi:ComF family protein